MEQLLIIEDDIVLAQPGELVAVDDLQPREDVQAEKDDNNLPSCKS